VIDPESNEEGNLTVHLVVNERIIPLIERKDGKLTFVTDGMISNERRERLESILRQPIHLESVDRDPVSRQEFSNLIERYRKNLPKGISKSIDDFAEEHGLIPDKDSFERYNEKFPGSPLSREEYEIWFKNDRDVPENMRRVCMQSVRRICADRDSCKKQPRNCDR